MTPEAATIEEDKIYLVDGKTLKKLLNWPERVKGAQGDLDASVTPDGNVTIKFASPLIFFGWGVGEAAAWTIPAQPAPQEL